MVLSFILKFEVISNNPFSGLRANQIHAILVNIKNNFQNNCITTNHGQIYLKTTLITNGWLLYISTSEQILRQKREERGKKKKNMIIVFFPNAGREQNAGLDITLDNW